jgi:uncharacterized protein (DUF983 family)
VGKVSRIFNYKCPRCGQGRIYKEPFNFKKPLEMPEKCEVCALPMLPEPGYYYGAMFLSYIVTGWLYLAVIGFCMLVLKMSVEQSFLVLLVFVALTYFRTARMARALWLNIMVKYDENWSKK